VDPIPEFHIGPMGALPSARSEAGHEPEQALHDCTDGQAHDDIARPMCEEDDPREHQAASDRPDGISLDRRQHRRGRCQGADMDRVSRRKGIEPLSG
jgi:hypothetical protein